MKQLTRTDLSQWRDFCEQMREASKAIAEAREAYTEEVDLIRTDLEAAWDELQTAVGAYQDITADAAQWFGEVIAAAEDWRSERGERWIDSPAGASHVAWCEQMRELQAKLEASSNHDDDVPEIGETDTSVPIAPMEESDAPIGMQDISDEESKTWQ